MLSNFGLLLAYFDSFPRIFNASKPARTAVVIPIAKGTDFCAVVAIGLNLCSSLSNSRFVGFDGWCLRVSILLTIIVVDQMESHLQQITN